MKYFLGLESDEPGIGTWEERGRVEDSVQLQVDFAYPDGTHTTTSTFLAHSAPPGLVRTEAGTFAFDGNRGGSVTFEPSTDFVHAVEALGRKIYVRELLACGLSRINVQYIKAALEYWPHERFSTISGMHMFGVTIDDMAEAVAQNPNIAPSTVMMSIARSRNERGS